jgi:hypothetical protein
MHSVTKTNQSLLISYRTLRKIVGILGLSLPFTLLGGVYVTNVLLNGGLVSALRGENSVSSDYHTEMRDVFVGTLCVIGFFLLSYRGHERKDNVAGNIAGVSALGVAFVPTLRDGSTDSYEIAIGNFHYFFAAVFFVTLIYFCAALFTKTHKGVTPTARKQQRNKVYRFCGITMAICISLILLCHFYLLDKFDALNNLRPVYWLESLAITAFGFSWLTKGRALLDEKADY